MGKNSRITEGKIVWRHKNLDRSYRTTCRAWWLGEPPTKEPRKYFEICDSVRCSFLAERSARKRLAHTCDYMWSRLGRSVKREKLNWVSRVFDVDVTDTHLKRYSLRTWSSTELPTPNSLIFMDPKKYHQALILVSESPNCTARNVCCLCKCYGPEQTNFFSALLPQVKLLVLLGGNAMCYERLQGEKPFMKCVGKQVLNSSKAECPTF